MSNTSATGGYLTPEAGPLTRTAVEDLLHDAVVGITGLPDQLVRPRWQTRPPEQPEASTDWCSIGVLARPGEGNPAVVHDGDGDGSDTVISWERIEVQASFYGPAAEDLAGRLRDGLAVEQNRAQLRAAGLALGSVGEPRSAPDLVHNEWLRRVDLDLVLNNENRRAYPVRNILCGPATIESDNGLVVQTAPMNEEN